MKKKYIQPEVELQVVKARSVIMVSFGIYGDMDGNNTANAPAFDYEW